MGHSPAPADLTANYIILHSFIECAGSSHGALRYQTGPSFALKAEAFIRVDGPAVSSKSFGCITRAGLLSMAQSS